MTLRSRTPKLALNDPSERMNELTPQPDFILYTSPDGEVKFEVFVQNETIWLTQKMMAELFGVEIPTISYHLTEIYKTAELSEDRTLRKIRIVQKEGEREVKREVKKSYKKVGFEL